MFNIRVYWAKHPPHPLSQTDEFLESLWRQRILLYCDVWRKQEYDLLLATNLYDFISLQSVEILSQDDNRPEGNKLNMEIVIIPISLLKRCQMTTKRPPIVYAILIWRHYNIFTVFIYWARKTLLFADGTVLTAFGKNIVQLKNLLVH